MKHHLFFILFIISQCFSNGEALKRKLADYEISDTDTGLPRYKKIAKQALSDIEEIFKSDYAKENSLEDAR